MNESPIMSIHGRFFQASLSEADPVLAGAIMKELGRQQDQMLDRRAPEGDLLARIGDHVNAIGGRLSLLAPVVERHVRDIAELADPRVIDEHVDAAEALHGVVDQAFGVGRIPHIRADGVNVVTALERAGGRLEIGVLPGADRDLHTAIEKSPRDRQPDPLRSTRDNADHIASAYNQVEATRH